ncbi:MAG TPA: mechanosensitive ion channel family protein [Thermoanaerobaculia bacterium]
MNRVMVRSTLAKLDPWDWLQFRYLGNSVLQWLTALGITLAVLLLLLLLKRLLRRRFVRLARVKSTELDAFGLDLLRRTRSGLLLLVSLYLGAQELALAHKVDTTLRAFAMLAALLQIALWASTAIDFWVAYQRRRRLPVDAASATLVGALNFTTKLVLWAIILLLALDNLGVNVTALVAGLGVGGIAVALALQNILSDILASLSIVVDKPFVLGETIQVETLVGTVESVGLKTTRLRSLSGEQLIFSNSDLLKSRIRNLSRMSERRVVLALSLDLATPADVVAAVPGVVRAIVEGKEQVRFDRSHFKGIGAGALDFEAVYFVTTPDNAVHMDRQQEIGLELLRALAERGAKLASSGTQVLLTALPPSGDASTATSPDARESRAR